MTDLDVRVRHVLDELEGMILERYPMAAFELSRGPDDPEQVHLITTVDIDDTDEVMDLVVDRLLELQIGEGLPVYVIPVRPMYRVMEKRRRGSAAGDPRRQGSPPPSPDEHASA